MNKRISSNLVAFVFALVMLASLVASKCHPSCAACNPEIPNVCLMCASGYKETTNKAEHPTGCESTSSVGSNLVLWIVSLACYACCCLLPCAIVLGLVIAVLTCGLSVIGLGASAASKSGVQTVAPMRSQDVSMVSSAHRKGNHGAY